MRIGINEVVVYERSSGTRQRELNLLPKLLSQIKANRWQALVYVARNLNEELLKKLVGSHGYHNTVRTPIPAIPTYARVLKGMFYWPRRVQLDHLSLFHTSYYPVPRLSTATVLTVNDVRFIHLPESYRPLRRLFLRLTVGVSLQRATRLITISHDTKNDLVKYFGLPSTKIDIIHIPLNRRFHPVTQEHLLVRARRRYSLPDKFILFVGHLEPRKNLRRLVQAFERLRTEYGILHKLVILGKPSFAFESLFEMVGDSQVKESIVFTGYVADEDMPAVYSLADVLAFPSLHEGFGVPVIEAMACGTPVVTSNLSALPEVAGDAALLVDPYSVEAIANGILEVITNANLHDDLVHKGFERVKNFDAASAAKSVCETYSKALYD